MTACFSSAVLLLGAATLTMADDFSARAAPLLEKYCYRCHGVKKQEGGIELNNLLSTESAYRQHHLLQSVAHAVGQGQMPPDDAPRQPSAAERMLLAAEIARVQSQLQEGRFPRNPGRTTVRRLNRTEYDNTVRDLFGVDFRPGRDFPADGAGGEGFDNVGDALFVHPALLEKYLAAAKEVVAHIYADPAALDRLLVRRPTDSTSPASAARDVLLTHASLAFRRRVSEEDLVPLLGLFGKRLEAGADFAEALRAPFEALLLHPAFLFRIEQDIPGKSEWRVNDFELATRLAAFLWASAPDRTLLKLAEANRLHEPSVLREQTVRMLADPRAESLALNFAAQWLGFDALRDVAQPDRERFPAFTDSLRTAMTRESVAFFDFIVRNNRPATELLNADYTFLNAELASHYGIAGVKGEKLRRVSLRDANRGGIIGQAAILTATSQPLRTSPVKRGKWVLDTLLGTPPPPPPPGAGVLPADDRSSAGLSLRSQLEAHRAQPECAGCHAKMDPLGFGLENFDAIGRWRDTDANGKAIDSAASLPGNRKFSTPAELKKVLLESDDLFLRNLARKMLGYALGRPLEYYDEPVISELVAGLRRDGLKTQALIHGIVSSHPFQNRSSKR